MTGKIAIIGSNSFSGNSFAAHLLEQQGCLSISRSSDLNPTLDRREKSTQIMEERRLIWNLNENSDHVIDAFQKEEITTVVNFAAQSMVGQSWLSPEDWYQANVVSLAKILNRIRLETGVKKFVQFTTPEVYGSTEGWIKESFDFKPNTPYAISRAASDWHLKALNEKFGFPVIFTRAANVYGEGQPLYRIVPKVILFGLLGRKIPLQGGGKSVRSFIHISDVNNALDLVIENGVLGNTYHISTKELVSIIQLVEIIAKKLSISLDDLVEMVDDRPGKDFAYQLDSQKIREELKWKDQISLDEGLDQTISWVEDNLDKLRKIPTDYTHRK
jgi:dTDP-glucose 4,6-dehydratase